MNETQQRTQLLLVLILLHQIVPIVGPGGPSIPIEFPEFPLSLSTNGTENNSWSIGDPSQNCLGDIAQLIGTTVGISNTLNFYGWNTSALDERTWAYEILFDIYSYEYEATCYDEPLVKLYDRCGSEVAVTPTTTKTSPATNYYQRRYNWTLPTPVSVDYYKQNVLVGLQVPVIVDEETVASCSWAPSCAKLTVVVDSAGSLLHITIHTLVTFPSDSDPCPQNPTPTTSVTPSKSASPAITTSVSRSPSITPSVSRSPSTTPTVTPTPSVSPSSTPSPVSPSVTPSKTPSPSVTPSKTPSSSTTPSISPSNVPSRTSSPSSSILQPASPSSVSRSGSGGNTGTIVGAVVGVVVGLGLIAALAFLLITRRKKEQKELNPNNVEDNSAANASVVPLSDRASTNSTNSPYTDFPRDSQIGLAVAPATLITNPRASTLSSELYIDDIKLKGLLGKGKFGEVYEGLWHGTTAVACKKLKKDDQEEFENEIRLLILGIYNQPNSGEIFMILELLRLGSLTNFLRNPESQKKLAIADLIEMCVHAASGMVFLEQKNIVHRDLGARNLLVTESDGRYVVKIADFGLSRQVEENEAIYNSKEGVFPVKWSPPEVINFRKFTSKSDVWSFAITMWEIFELGKVPYPTLNNDETVGKVLKGYRLPKPDTCPEGVYKLMLQCWSANPDDRPNFKSIHETLLQILRSIKGEDEEEMKYTSEDTDKNYNYNTGKPSETYNNNNPQMETYNTGNKI